MTSAFYGHGKKTAWTAWQNTPCLTEVLLALTDDPTLISTKSEFMQKLERFVVLMYSKTCGLDSVNSERHHLSTTGY